MSVETTIVPEDSTRLFTLTSDGSAPDPQRLVAALKRDEVVLVRGLSPVRADALMRAIASALALQEALELQARFAAVLGHRQSVGEYFMSVNARDEYQYIPPHCEGTTAMRMQLASFYCHENTTDGGHTILFNLDPASNAWSALKERVVRAKLTRALATREVATARAVYKVDVPKDVLTSGEQPLRERPTDIPGLSLVDVLVPLQKTRSVLLDRDVYVYWDSVASIDHDAAPQYERLLREAGLLREGPSGSDLRTLDNASPRRIYHSSVQFRDLFKSKLTHKLESGELVVFNNVTWAHSASNWTPGSGVRKVTAAFA